MESHKAKEAALYVRKPYQKASDELQKARNVEAQWALLTKMIHMGFRPHRADMAKALHDHISLEHPRIVPRAILLSLLGELIRDGRGGPREMTMEDFLSHVDAPVQLSRSLHHEGRSAKKKGAYEDAILETSKAFKISKNTLEAMRKRYKQMVRKADYEE